MNGGLNATIKQVNTGDKTMRNELVVRAENFQPQPAKRIIRPLLAATLGLAITFTLSCSSGDDPDNGNGGNPSGSNISDLPKQAYLAFENDKEQLVKIGEYKDGGNIKLLLDQYESKPAGEIQAGQVLLNLPNIEGKYLKNVDFCSDGAKGYECNVSFPENLALFPTEELFVTIPDKNNCQIGLHLVGGANRVKVGLLYSSKSGEISGKKCGHVLEGVCIYEDYYDLNISIGWNVIYGYYANEDIYYNTTDLSKTGGTLEWWINCNDD
jgi:hypothetical protein